MPHPADEPRAESRARGAYGRAVRAVRVGAAQAHEKLGDPHKAASHMADALAIFRRTVGHDSPLTANAMACLGKVKASLGETKEGLALLKAAIKLEASKDAFHLETVWELFSKVWAAHMHLPRFCSHQPESHPPTHPPRADGPHLALAALLASSSAA